MALSDEKREELRRIIKTGKSPAYRVNHARILLKADINQTDGGWSDKAISCALDVGHSTIERVRQRFVEEGKESALGRKEQAKRKASCLNGEQEAHLIALACSDTPSGQGHWTMRLLASKMTALDYAHVLKDLVDLYYPDAWLITVVQDQLNTHSPSSLYKAFPPAEARRILNRLQFCYTPKYGSWLNRAEIELSVLKRPCLDRRLGDIDTLRTEVDAWQKMRNQKGSWIDWRFTPKDARIKLKRLYPSIPD